MTVIGLDDTDSRERGMCTTYLATRIADCIEAADGDVHRRLLVRLNPAVEHKTRGNAALAIHTDLDADRAFEIAREQLSELAETADDRTAPGLVVAPIETESLSGSDLDPGSCSEAATTIPASVATFARKAVREFHTLDETLSLVATLGWRHRGWGGGTGTGGTTGVGDGTAGRGRIGALAAIGAWRAFDEWTYEGIAYREFDRCGSPREVDSESVFTAAETGYPTVWDTVDRTAGEPVCVPHAPGPILYGIRGDEPEAIAAVMAAIDAEPVERSALFRTNQGTDAHLRDADEFAPNELQIGRSYRLTGVVVDDPGTRRGGHVFVDLAIGPAVDGSAPQHDGSTPQDDGSIPRHDGSVGIDTSPDSLPADAAIVRCAAFEPTKRFRDRVRALCPGDRVTACGELDAARPAVRSDTGSAVDSGSDSKAGSGPGSESDLTTDSIGTLKLEKFAVRSLTRIERVTPTCPECERTMESAGREQGYRCRDCETTAPGKDRQPIERDLERGWYEVPPLARRHIAKPLVRGGFDAPVHPER